MEHALALRVAPSMEAAGQSPQTGFGARVEREVWLRGHPAWLDPQVIAVTPEIPIESAFQGTERH